MIRGWMGRRSHREMKGTSSGKLTMRARIFNDPANNNNNNIESVFAFGNARLRVSESPLFFLFHFPLALYIVRLLYFFPLYLKFLLK